MFDNYFIADQFSLLSKLMDIHGENSFKSKTYSVAAFTIEKLPVPLNSLSPADLVATKGIGESTGKKIMEILQTGKLAVLEQLIANTPPGIIDMMQIKGIGPKKIHTIWKEMQIESLGELLYACEENRLLLYKGFGAKTQQNVKEAIEYYLSHQDQFLFAELESYALTLLNALRTTFPQQLTELSGEFRRQMEIIRSLDVVTTTPLADVSDFFQQQQLHLLEAHKDKIVVKGEKCPIQIRCTSTANFPQVLFETSCSPEFLDAWQQRFTNHNVDAEAELFAQQQLTFIPPCRREFPSVIDQATKGPLPELIQPSDVQGIIHSHSNWSDGSNTIEEMAKACIEKGMEYLVISDHSKSAFYANGLNEERILAQHLQIDALNQQLAPFRIYKSIECDILNDGSLDYPDEVLARFDLVIVSVHSNLKMSEEKAMTRLLTAIANPYTTILGHMTGRLLLSRPGYPVDHQRIIEACKAHDVVIELNAHPRRLDIDWRFIEVATAAGVRISIDPDAHAIDGYDDIRFGVLVAQKAGLTAGQNLSSCSRVEFDAFLSAQQSKRQR